MSKPDQHFNKVLLYVLIGVLVLSSIFILMMFGPGPNVTNSLFETSLRYYTKGTDKLYYTDYASTIEQDIKEIGIYVEDYPMEYSTFLDKIFAQKDFEMAIIEIEGENAPHLETLFREGGSLNVFNFRDTLDNGTTSSYLNNITKAYDFYERKNALLGLQEHLMVDILPMVPIFTPVRTFAYWNNLEGFSGSLGLSDSLPYMSFNGLHENQESINELKIGVGGWFDLNPFTVAEDAEKLLVSLIMDKLISLDSKGTPTKYGLIDNWEYLNSTTLLLHVRDGVKWQPDIDEIFPNEMFSIDDVIFTLDLARDIYANLNYELFKWIKSYGVYNSTTVAIYIDSNSTTPEREPYAFPLEDLSIYPYPAYYLNVESTVQQIVQSGRWTKFRQNPFGTGKYRFNATASQVGLTAELYKNTQWHGVGVLEGQATNLTFDKIEANSRESRYSLNLDLQEGTRVDWADFGKDPAIRTAIPTGNFIIDYHRENSLIFLAFNLENEQFGGDNNFIPTNITGVSRGLAIRRAIASIIRKSMMNEQFHDGIFNITDSPVSMFFTDYYNQGITTYPYSVENAINYLIEAGFNITTADSITEETSFNLISTIIGLGITTPLAIFITRKKRKVKTNDKNK